MMVDVENFVESPGALDVPVSTVFTEDMFSDLEVRMTKAGWAGVPKVRSFWENDYRGRTIINGFMKDKSLGAKRLTSMPDRITNTINVVGSSSPVCRPTTINMYDGDLSTLPIWWSRWSAFMFDTPLTIQSKNGPETLKVYEMLSPIKSAKYPAITAEEEEISIPLQVLAHAIFDSIQVHSEFLPSVRYGLEERERERERNRGRDERRERVVVLPYTLSLPSSKSPGPSSPPPSFLPFSSLSSSLPSSLLSAPFCLRPSSLSNKSTLRYLSPQCSTSCLDLPSGSQCGNPS